MTELVRAIHKSCSRIHNTLQKQRLVNEGSMVSLRSYPRDERVLIRLFFPLSLLI